MSSPSLFLTPQCRRAAGFEQVLTLCRPSPGFQNGSQKTATDCFKQVKRLSLLIKNLNLTELISRAIFLLGVDAIFGG
ncbi:hypothetical protein [Pseudomonas sp. PA27(2017)]|uniref:hypothetical protein n=1 Tax=Pseudomonas sp. PA27(2017) TaxID=1932112 RepID=UPI001115178D|nr:hypothetical protein [Pseudomonas sp. PA27(2017)]